MNTLPSGRMFEPEQIGARQAMDFLISEGYVAHGATLTCLEIPKRSFTPLRLFEVGFDRANFSCGSWLCKNAMGRENR